MGCLDKTASSSPLGFDLDQDTLEILKVKDGGLVAQWNEACSDESRRIKPGDRIVDLNGKKDANGVMDQLRSSQLLEFTLVRTPPVEPVAASGNQDGASQKCPISGKEGMACPMSMFLPSKPPQPTIEPAPPASSTGAKTGFMAGKSIVKTVQNQQLQKVGGSSWEESFLYKICPIHWDTTMAKVIITIAAISWISGFIFGWSVRKMAFK